MHDIYLQELSATSEVSAEMVDKDDGIFLDDGSTRCCEESLTLLNVSEVRLAVMLVEQWYNGTIVQWYNGILSNSK